MNAPHAEDDLAQYALQDLLIILEKRKFKVAVASAVYLLKEYVKHFAILCIESASGVATIC